MSNSDTLNCPECNSLDIQRAPPAHNAERFIQNGSCRACGLKWSKTFVMASFEVTKQSATDRLSRYPQSALSKTLGWQVWHIADNVAIAVVENGSYALVTHHTDKNNEHTIVETVFEGKLYHLLDYVDQAKAIGWACGEGSYACKELCASKASHALLEK